MNQMEELYRKVAGDPALQAKFAERMKDAETAGGDAAKAILTEFAKEAGYEISFEEMMRFFAEQKEQMAGELSDAELDAVAGGKAKTTGGGLVIGIFTSIFTVGVICATISITQTQTGSDCTNYFNSAANGF